MDRDYKKITVILILLDIVLFVLLSFLFKEFFILPSLFLVKLVINLSVFYKKKLKPVLIFDGILALLPILAIVIPFFIQLFVQPGPVAVVSSVVIIFGIYTIPISIVYGGLLLTLKILSFLKKTMAEHEEE